jgi:hypothetical protein
MSEALTEIEGKVLGHLKSLPHVLESGLEPNVEPLPGEKFLRYPCPCGGEHDALRFLQTDGRRADILNCFCSGAGRIRQWYIRNDIDPADVIRKEEIKFLALLEKSPRLLKKAIKKFSNRDAFTHFMLDTHGVPKEISEPYWDERREVKP